MTNPTDANAILMGNGAPTLKFPQIGFTVTGTITSEPEAIQQTDFRTKMPEFWPDNSPKMQVVVKLATSLRDPERTDDDGIRSLYINGKYLTEAVRNAVKASGAKGLHTGGVLTIQYQADGPIAPGLDKGPKLYGAHYQPPAVSLNGITGPVQPVQEQMYVPQPVVPQQVQPIIPQHVPQAVVPQQVAPVQQVQQVVPQHIPANVVQSVTPNVAQDAPPAGIAPEMWARLTPDQKAAVAANMAQPAY